MAIDKKEVKKKPSLESLSDDVFLSIRKMSLEDLKDLIKQCREASRFNCSWQSYYMATTIMNFAIHCLDLVGLL
jgi:hypothetical protein